MDNGCLIRQSYGIVNKPETNWTYIKMGSVSGQFSHFSIRSSRAHSRAAAALSLPPRIFSLCVSSH